MERQAQKPLSICVMKGSMWKKPQAAKRAAHDVHNTLCHLHMLIVYQPRAGCNNNET